LPTCALKQWASSSSHIPEWNVRRGIVCDPRGSRDSDRLLQATAGQRGAPEAGSSLKHDGTVRDQLKALPRPVQELLR
jgi:hypothetical protein